MGRRPSPWALLRNAGFPSPWALPRNAGLPPSRGGAVGEGRVVLTVHGTAAFAVGVAAERGLAVLARCAVGGRFAFTVETRRFP